MAKVTLKTAREKGFKAGVRVSDTWSIEPNKGVISRMFKDKDDWIIAIIKEGDRTFYLIIYNPNKKKWAKILKPLKKKK